MCGVLAGLITSAIADGAIADGADRPADYLGPAALVAAADGKTLYVACGDARCVLWVDLEHGAVVRRAEVPDSPTGIVLTPDQRRLVVTCAAPRSTVLVLDPETGQTVGRIPVGHTAAAAAVDPQGRRLYVCNRFDDDISVVDLVAGTELARVPVVREPVAVAVTPDGRQVLVANHLPKMRTDVGILGDVNGVVSLIDAQSLETRAIPLPNGSTGLRGLTITPDGRHAFVTHLLSNFQEVPFRVETGWINTNVITVIDIARQRHAGAIGLDDMDRGSADPWGVACSPDGRFLCVAAAGAHEVNVIERETLLTDEVRHAMSPMMGVWPIYVSLGQTYWQRVPLPGKGPRAVTVANGRAYVAEYFSDSIADIELTPDGPVLRRTLALGASPQLSAVRRGELLFNDATICYQQWQSCASCHPDGRADALNWDLTNDGQGNTKNSKSLLLAHATPPSMARGVRPTAEDAVRSGMLHILFMRRPEAEAAAIDAYLKTLEPVPSPRLVDGRLTPAAERGRQLFADGALNCARCHPAPLYTDLASHNVGTRTPKDQADRFDTPTLVECWRTAPYLHDGRYVTLRELLQEGRHGLPRNRELSPQELGDLAEFVESL